MLSNIEFFQAVDKYIDFEGSRKQEEIASSLLLEAGLSQKELNRLVVDVTSDGKIRYYSPLSGESLTINMETSGPLDDDFNFNSPSFVCEISGNPEVNIKGDWMDVEAWKKALATMEAARP